MYYTIYQITNLINNKIYIGQHSTKNIEDNYFGSGKNIKRAIKKCGKENFKKEILFVFDNFDDMNNKEREIVNEDFIRRVDTYNICLGGGDYLCEKIINVKNKATNLYEPITLSEYQKNKNLYEHQYKNKTTVYDTIKNINVFIDKSAFNPEIHRYNIGGVVVEKNGIIQKISKEEFDAGGYSGLNKGTLPVKILETGEVKLVPKDEYKNNKHLYSMPTTGKVSAKNLETGEYSSIALEEYNNNKHLWNATTKGERTVFDIETNQWKNIPMNSYDKNIHRLALDKKFICYDENENELFAYWGSKNDFIKEYEIPETLWSCLLDDKTYYTKRKANKKFNGWHFKLIDWKKELVV